MAKFKLEDVVDDNTKILFCGMAPGKLACEMNHYYANPGNRFWSVLREAGLVKSIIIPSRINLEREKNYNKLTESDIGLTDLVKNQCGMDKIINVNEGDIERLQNLVRNSKNLKLLIFNGKKPASKFLKIKTKKLTFAYQKEVQQLPGVTIYIIPSTSGVNTKFSIKYIADLLKSFIRSEVNTLI